MNTPLPDDPQWKALLSHAAPTFAPHEEPPFGFMTSTLARIKSERKDRELLERIGFRAIFASLAILVAVGGITLGLQLQSSTEFDPGYNNVLEVEHVPLV
jgi:hypothetical protein